MLGSARRTRALLLASLVGGGALIAVGIGRDAVSLAAPRAPSPATATAAVPGTSVDLVNGSIDAVASAAADLYAASADIARTKAERLARSRAEERLRKALANVVRSDGHRLSAYGGVERVKALDPARAQQLSVEYGSTGSVTVKLRLSLREPPPSPPDLGAADAAPALSPENPAGAP